jgi:hypothetical protein
MLRGVGALLMVTAVGGALLAMVRWSFPELPWHALPRCGVRPPVQPWQGWTFLGGCFAIGLRMVLVGQRGVKADPSNQRPQ